MSSTQRNNKTKILEACLRQFMESGYRGVGLEQVAREAGVSRQAVYLHFQSKAGLLVAAMRHIDQMVGIAETLQQALESGTALDTLDAMTAAYAAIEPQIYKVASFLYSARRDDPAAEAAWQDRMVFRRESSRKIVEKLRREGLLSRGWTVDAAADFVTALLSLRTYEYLVVERGWTRRRFVKRLRTVLHSTIVKQPDSRMQ